MTTFSAAQPASGSATINNFPSPTGLSWWPSRKTMDLVSSRPRLLGMIRSSFHYTPKNSWLPTPRTRSINYTLLLSTSGMITYYDFTTTFTTYLLPYHLSYHITYLPTPYGPCYYLHLPYYIIPYSFISFTNEIRLINHILPYLT